MSVVRERERGTLEQLLVSPLSRWGFMLGKLIPYWVLGMAMAIVLLCLMRFLFQVPIAGSLVALFVATLLYTFALLSIGLLVSTRAGTQMQALQMSMASILPSVFFSGFIFPRETMPWIFYAIGSVLPTTYYIESLRAIILRGADLRDFAQHLGVLALMGAVLFVLCSLRFRKRLN
jgi:ABC-2 type transport system permease protein